MSITIVQLNKLAFKAKQMNHRRNIMKNRVKMSEAIKHRETCDTCKSMFNALREVEAYSSAATATQSLMTSLVSKRVH